MKEKDKKQKVYKGMTAPVDVNFDIPETEIWTYHIDGLAAPHIDKPFKNFTLKKIVFVVLILIAVGLSMFFSVKVVSRQPFEYNQLEDGTYEFVKFNNTGYIKKLDIDYALTIEDLRKNNLVTDGNITAEELLSGSSSKFRLIKDETMPISEIPQFCFNCDETVEEIYIGKSVRKIDGKAFFTCRALKRIIVDEENEYYCDIDGVLYNKDKTEIIYYPMNHPAYLREKYGYNDAIWPDNPEFYAKYKNEVLTYVLPSTVETIGQLCFYDVPIAALFMPEGLKRIESMSIFRCWYLSDINSYETSTAGDETGYAAVEKLSGVYRSLPEGLEYIGSDAMSYNRSSNYLRIPSSVTHIGHHAFWDTVDKKDGKFEGNEFVYIASSESKFENVEKESKWIPEYDSGLLDKKSVLVYDTEKKYHEPSNYAEYYVENENKESELRGYELTSFINTEKLTELSIDYVCTLENGELKKDETKPVASIANMAFKWDTYIEKVYIGKDVEKLSGGTFYKLNALKQIIVDKDNKNYCDVDGVLYNKDKTEVIFCPAEYSAYLNEKYGYDKAVEEGTENYEQYKSDVLTYVVPSTVKKIGRACFFDSAFVEIYLPEGIERIEPLSLLMSRNLKEVYSYKDSKPTATDGSAVSTLENVYRSLPEGLQFIGVDTLNYTAVDYIYIPASVTEIDPYAFTHVSGVSSVDVAADKDTFKNVKKGDHWLPEYKTEKSTNESVDINYSAERKAMK